MESLFFTPKRNRNRIRDSEPSPEENKRLKESNSPAESSSDEETFMEAIVNKLYFIWRLTVEGIPERKTQGEIQDRAPTEDTKGVLSDFLENILGIQDAHSIEFQRMHRLGKPRTDNDKDRVIIARFLRYSDREREF